jgi:hypothetical protein
MPIDYGTAQDGKRSSPMLPRGTDGRYAVPEERPPFKAMMYAPLLHLTAFMLASLTMVSCSVGFKYLNILQEDNAAYNTHETRLSADLVPAAGVLLFMYALVYCTIAQPCYMDKTEEPAWRRFFVRRLKKDPIFPECACTPKGPAR